VALEAQKLLIEINQKIKIPRLLFALIHETYEQCELTEDAG
jgi:hypothetical protein